MDTRSFIKIDSVLIYEVEDEVLQPVENQFSICEDLEEEYFNLELIFYLEDSNETLKFYSDKPFLDLVKKERVNNFDLIDFAYYLKMLSFEQDTLLDKANLVEDYQLFIKSIKQFRQDAIIKNSFKIKQKRISRKKIEELQEKINLWEEDF